LEPWGGRNLGQKKREKKPLKTKKRKEGRNYKRTTETPRRNPKSFMQTSSSPILNPGGKASTGRR